MNKLLVILPLLFFTSSISYSQEIYLKYLSINIPDSWNIKYGRPKELLNLDPPNEGNFIFSGKSNKNDCYVLVIYYEQSKNIAELINSAVNFINNNYIELIRLIKERQRISTGYEINNINVKNGVISGKKYYMESFKVYLLDNTKYYFQENYFILLNDKNDSINIIINYVNNSRDILNMINNIIQSIHIIK